MSFRVLDAANASDRAVWIDLWSRWSGKEVFAHPDYVALFARPNDRCIAATWSMEPGGVLYPLIARPLASEPWATGNAALDLTTPYGYGGAYAWGSARDRAEEFWSAFDAWAAHENVVASFARLALFPDQLLAPRGVVEARQNNVVRKLDLDSEATWRDYAHKVRKNVNRARQSGLTVERDDSGERLDAFLEIYASTMTRRQALATYLFPREFFQSIVERLRGSYTFFHVLHESKVVSTELVLVSDHHIYSFLGGTLEEAFELRPNDLLKHEVIEWGRSAGKKAFVLGGGYQGDDGIYRYKLSFAPEGAVPFRIATRTHDEHRVQGLVEARREHERREGRDWLPGAYFPPYRG